MLVPVCALATFAILANALAMVMVGRVNSKLPEREWQSYFFYNFRRLREAYRNFYPDSRLPYFLWLCVIGMATSFIAAAVIFLK